MSVGSKPTKMDFFPTEDHAILNQSYESRTIVQNWISIGWKAWTIIRLSLIGLWKVSNLSKSKCLSNKRSIPIAAAINEAGLIVIFFPSHKSDIIGSESLPLLLSVRTFSVLSISWWDAPRSNLAKPPSFDNIFEFDMEQPTMVKSGTLHVCWCSTVWISCIAGGRDCWDSCIRSQI